MELVANVPLRIRLSEFCNTLLYSPVHRACLELARES